MANIYIPFGTDSTGTTSVGMQGYKKTPRQLFLDAVTDAVEEEFGENLEESDEITMHNNVKAFVKAMLNFKTENFWPDDEEGKSV